jgi:hypothetical protein
MKIKNDEIKEKEVKIMIEIEVLWKYGMKLYVWIEIEWKGIKERVKKSNIM